MLKLAPCMKVSALRMGREVLRGHKYAPTGAPAPSREQAHALARPAAQRGHGGGCVP
jgi:hypothetical protein